MSILGYSSSYFLPEYWSDTPFYGEKLIPLVDYMLSSDYEESNKLAKAYYNMLSKYKNPLDLPIENIEALIDECGYTYIRKLLGDNEESLRMLISLIGLIHVFKGSEIGLELVLNLMRGEKDALKFDVVGNPTIKGYKIIEDFTVNDFAIFRGINIDTDDVELRFKFTVRNFNNEQCLCSIPDYGMYIGINTNRQLVLSLSSERGTWNIANGLRSNRTLSLTNEYYLRLIYDGFEYSLQISTDGEKYTTYISVETDKVLNVVEGSLYLGVDSSQGVIQQPFSGTINYSDLNLVANDIEIKAWYESFPVLEENTFSIDTELDLDLISPDFFTNFAEFIENYVYPTLINFKAKATLTSSLSFLIYNRQKIEYDAFTDLDNKNE